MRFELEKKLFSMILNCDGNNVNAMVPCTKTEKVVRLFYRYRRLSRFLIGNSLQNNLSLYYVYIIVYIRLHILKWYSLNTILMYVIIYTPLLADFEYLDWYVTTLLGRNPPR